MARLSTEGLVGLLKEHIQQHPGINYKQAGRSGWIALLDLNVKWFLRTREPDTLRGDLPSSKCKAPHLLYG